MKPIVFTRAPGWRRAPRAPSRSSRRPRAGVLRIGGEILRDAIEARRARRPGARSLGSSRSAAAHAMPSTLVFSALLMPRNAARGRPAHRGPTWASASSRYRRGSMSVPAYPASCTPSPGTRSREDVAYGVDRREAGHAPRVDARDGLVAHVLHVDDGNVELGRERAHDLLLAWVDRVPRRREPRAAQDRRARRRVDLAVDVEAGRSRSALRCRAARRRPRASRASAMSAAIVRASSLSIGPSAANTARSTRTASEPRRFTRCTSLSLGLDEKSDRMPRAPTSSVTFSASTSAIGIHDGGQMGAIARVISTTHASKRSSMRGVR